MRLQSLEMVRETNSLEKKFGPTQSQYDGAKAERNNETQKVSALCLPPCRRQPCRRGRNDAIWFGSHPLSHPSPKPGVQRDPEPTAEGATEGLFFSPCTGRQDPGTAAAAAAAPLRSPRAPPLSRANPEQRGAPGGRSPFQKENNPHCLGPASSEPRRDGSLAGASPQLVLVRCPPRFPHLELPIPSTSVPPRLAAAFWGVRVCLPGPAELRETRRAVTRPRCRHSPLRGRLHRGVFSHPPNPLARTAKSIWEH